jgi:formate--tetrahydrofolate ligase
VPVVVAVNRFPYDTEKELKVILDRCRQLKVPAAVADIWAKGGEGGRDLAGKVIKAVDGFKGNYQPLYRWKSKVRTKISTIAREIYGAGKVEFSRRAQRSLARIEDMGLSHLPICMVKTQKSLSDDPLLLGRPKGFVLNVQEIRIASGAGFLIPITGDILTMPGLPRNPVAEEIEIDDEGKITGLF